MKALSRILLYEMKACLRQLSSAIRLNTIECILLVALGILLSAALSYIRLATSVYSLLMPALFIIGLIFGLISFNKRNALELISSEKNQALRTLPLEYRVIQFAKIEKLLFASFIIYSAVCLYIFAVMLLSGSPLSAIIHIIASMLAFSAGQTLRSLILVIGNRFRYLKHIAIIATTCAITVVFRSGIEWRTLLSSGYTFYTENIILLLLAALAFILIAKVALMLVHSTGQMIQNKSDMRGISDRAAELFSRFNPVTQHDLRGIMHSAKSRRRFISGLITLPALTWVMAIVMQLNIIPFEISTSCTAWMLALLIGTGCSGLFENQMTMGYEGNMILAYVLSGSSVSVLQRKRLAGSLAITLPLAALATLIATLLLGAGIADTFTAIAIATASCAALNCTNAYYLIKGTSYFNEMNRPRMASGIIRMVIKTLLDMLVMIPVTLAEFLAMGAVLPILLWSHVIICIAMTIIYWRKLTKGDRYFYGEYQSIAS